MTLETWLAFLVAAILISVSPGAGAVACMASGMRYGYRLGIWNIFGMQFGIALQLAVVGAGLGAILAASTLAFTVLKWLGVTYLAWLGVKAWRAPPVPVEVDRAAMPATTRGALFGQGFLVNATNPKATVFFLAVLPPFIDPMRALLPQYLTVVATLSVVDLVVMSGYTLFAARVLRLMRAPRQIRLMNRVFGGLFIGAAALLATFKRAA
ncbi:MAG: homoserine/homoserine lactone efflux protein [Burkholderiales bacterium]